MYCKMNKIRRDCNQMILFNLFLLFFIFIVFIQSVICAHEEFISVDEIYSGMKGIGKTVFSGTEVEEFDVQVIDIISGTTVNHPYILVKLSGDRIDENGGTSAGMSGSPVYLEGKLAGAISHAWEMSEHNLCLITPIESMITLFDYIVEDPKQSNSYRIEQQNISITLDYSLRKKLERAIPGFENAYADNRIIPNSSIHFRYIQSPLLISGFWGRANELLKNNLLQQGIASVQTIPRYQDFNSELKIRTEKKDLAPGSAVGVQLSTGDASVLTIGTATYCKDNFVLAFGHPFMHSGNVSNLFSAIYVYHSFPSLVMPFKVGSPYLLLGEVIQDREAGILAQLNRFPQVVSCKITISDLDKEVIVHTGAKVVLQNNIIQSVVSALLVQSIDHAINRIGQGTAVVHLGLQNARTGRKITLENRFFHQDDIAIQCDKDFHELFDLIINNYIEHIELSEIEVDIAIKEQNQSAIIKEVKIEEKDYFPGNTVEAQVIVKPFRKPIETKVARIALPDDMVPGEAILIIRGGASSEIMSEKNTASQDKEEYLLDGWEDIQEYVEKRVKNNQIISELILVNEQERLTLAEQTDERINKTELKVILNTDFIVEGYHEMYLNIKNKENRNKGLLDE